ncbi:MAG: type II secretion system F family protein [Clostridiales bacterium]|nr:type II secretion system F family protein [Clostridiales bacterium]
MTFTAEQIGFIAAKVILGIFLAAVLILIFIISRKTKGVYDEYLSPLDEKEFGFKNYLNYGLYLCSLINIGRFVPSGLKANYISYNNNVKNNIAEIYGIRYNEYYYDIHTATKWTASLFVFTGCIALSLVFAFRNNTENTLLFFGAAVLAAIGCPFYLDYRLYEKIEEKRFSIQLDFPEFINKLLLLVNAGLTISKAWEKIVLENKKKSPLYDELNYTMAEIEGGKPEAIAYEEFVRRCKIKEVIKCVSIIVPNLKKGGAQVVPALREQADDCWELRKAAARQQGEKASSKLMIPMAIMLIGIIMIVVMPAVMALQGV